MAKKVATRKAPQKECPKCNKMVAAATRTCECGHEFIATKKAPGKKSGTNVAKTIKTARDLIDHAGSVEDAIEILKLLR